MPNVEHYQSLKHTAGTSKGAMNSQPTGFYRLKAFAIAELVALMMALILPLIPGRDSEELINLPSEAAGYFHSVLLCFGLLNGILLALVVACWGYWIGKGCPSS